MKLENSLIKKLSNVSKEDAKKIVDAYEGAVISDIVYSSPKTCPTNFNVYASIKNKNGEVIVNATLSYCAERMAEVSFLKKMVI
jgi:hypothetical protein